MKTRMSQEISEAPSRLRHLLGEGRTPYQELAARLRRSEPPFVTTVARGSSDHAASYGAHLIATINQRVTASLPPSLATLYQTSLRVDGALALAVSQSGASPDLIAMIRFLKRAGALSAGLINAPGSALGDEVDFLLPQLAGSEESVAATKSVLCSMAGMALLSALWADNPALLEAIEQLPERVGEVLESEVRLAAELDIPHRTMFVIGRGSGLAVASEFALKLKETSAQPAMAFSPAELQHGPKAAIERDSPLLFIETADPGGQDVRRLRQSMTQSGYCCFAIGHDDGALAHLPTPLHPALDAIVAMAACYPIAERLALRRGLNPDQPRGLSKVTRTV